MHKDYNRGFISGALFHKQKSIIRKLLKLTSNTGKKIDFRIIGTRFIVTSNKCNTKPLTDVISKGLKWSLTMLKFFIEKVYFTHALKSFGLLKIHSQILQNWTK